MGLGRQGRRTYIGCIFHCHLVSILITSYYTKNEISAKSSGFLKLYLEDCVLVVVACVYNDGELSSSP